MAKITIHAGDFKVSPNDTVSAYVLGNFNLLTYEHPFSGELIPVNQVLELEKASEESVKKIGGTIGWGIAGAALLGPVGLLAGLLLGGRKNEVTFVCKFRDGRKLLGTTDSKTFTKIQAAVF